MQVTKIMQRVGSAMAGGYDTSRIEVLFAAPYYGMTPGKWNASRPQPVVEKDMGKKGRNGTGKPRRLLLLQQQKQEQQRRVLRADPAAAAADPAAVIPDIKGLTPVWVVYTQLDLLNATTLLRALLEACDGVHWVPGVDLANTSCGVETRRALQQAGIKVKKEYYQQLIVAQPMVSCAAGLVSSEDWGSG